MNAEKCDRCDEPVMAPGTMFCESHQDEWAKSNGRPDWRSAAIEMELEDE